MFVRVMAKRVVLCYTLKQTGNLNIPYSQSLSNYLRYNAVLLLYSNPRVSAHSDGIKESGRSLTSLTHILYQDAMLNFVVFLVFPHTQMS